MAPKGKHQSFSKYRKSTSRHQATASTSSAANNGNMSSINGSSIDNSSNNNTSAAHSSDITNADISSNEQSRVDVSSTYVQFERPSEQPFTVGNHDTGSNVNLPMERWQMGSMLDEPWHGIGGVVVHGEGSYGTDMYGQTMEHAVDDGYKEETGQDGSMCCEASQASGERAES